MDHIVEMETIVEYFATDWASTLGLSINQWDVVYALFESQGVTPILGVSVASLGLSFNICYSTDT